MSNQEIEKILREIGIYLEMEDVPFKPRAYERAADVISGLDKNLSDIYKKGGLKAIQNIPSVGVSIAKTIEDLIKTGSSKDHKNLQKRIPVKLGDFEAVEGVGPKTIKILYKKLKVKNIRDLEKAVKSKKIRNLSGFGIKSEENIAKSIEFLKKSGGRFIRGFIMNQIKGIESGLNNLKETKKIIVAGSTRRRKETIGDVDILVISKQPKKIMDYFVNMPEVARVYAHGNTKSSIKLKNGLDVDLRVVLEKSYGAALNYFTGSKNHNIRLRRIAISKGYKLNEYGLFRGEKWVAGKDEKGVYKKLGLDYIEPELREAGGELSAAKSHKLPNLIDLKDLKGDLHVHTKWSDGTLSIEEMAKEAISIGLKYMLISDHTKRLTVANGLDERRIKKQWLEIDKINKKIKSQGIKFRILKGTECDILKDGSMDLSDKILSKCDIVGGSVHSLFNLSKEEQTKRIMRAMSNPHVDIICHPTGRLINRREPYDVDMNKIINYAKKTKTILEINAFPDRLDLKDDYIRKCVEVGVKMSISSDAHAISHMHYSEFGVAQARRGWAKRSDIINAWSLDRMLSMLKNKKRR